MGDTQNRSKDVIEYRIPQAERAELVAKYGEAAVAWWEDIATRHSSAMIQGTGTGEPAGIFGRPIVENPALETPPLTFAAIRVIP